jgi:hypothetical protein
LGWLVTPGEFCRGGGTQNNTYRGQAGPSAAGGLQTSRGRANATERLSIGETVGIPGLGAGQVIGVGVVLQGRVQPLQPGGLVAGHLVLVQVDGHGAVRIKLARRLAVQGLLMPLGTRGTRGGIVIHVRLLITHGRGRIPRNVGTSKIHQQHAQKESHKAMRTWGETGIVEGTMNGGTVKKQAKSLTDAKSCSCGS